MPTIGDCKRCTEPCPQSARAKEAAKGRMYATKEMIALLKKVESGQLVEVVRCKDCKHFGRELSPGRYFCQNYMFPYCKPDDFCSYGERKDGDSNG